MTNKEINYDMLAGGDSLGSSANNSNGGHGGRKLGIYNPKDSFAFDNVDIASKNELHMRSNITDWEFLSSVNVCHTMFITTILLCQQQQQPYLI